MCPIAHGYRGKEEGDGPRRTATREELPQMYQEYLDSGFKWDGPTIQSTLVVELPFFLLIPDCTMQVRYEGMTCSLTILNECIEFSQSQWAFDSKINVISIHKEGKEDRESLQGIDCIIGRPMRTVIEIPVKLLAEVIDAWDDSKTVRVNRAAHYLEALALAYVPVLNELILAYRATSYDPVALGVSEWDVPFWFLRSGSKLIRISIMPYRSFTGYPTLGEMNSSEKHPVYTTTPELLTKRLAAGVSPGRREMHDAESLYYRGRYGDAVRSAVTAIEVALDAELMKVLKARGDSAEQMRAVFEESWNNFDKRLADYERISKRRVPGPMLHPVPYINGIQLKEEFGNTRRLRHKIVHEGKSIDFHSRGPMLRMIETTRWFYRWLTEYSDEDRHDEVGEFYSMTRGNVLNAFKYTAEGVVVGPHGSELVPDSEDEFESMLSDNIVMAQYTKSVTDTGGDIELFSAMSMSYLNIFHEDAPFEPLDDSIIRERYESTHELGKVLVFAIECDGLVDVDLIEKIERRMKAYPRQNGEKITVWCIFNHERHVPLERREIQGAISEAASKKLRALGAMAVTAHDLLLIVKGLARYKWQYSFVQDSLFAAGRQGMLPSHYQRIGQFNRIYAKHAALSLDLDDGVTLKIGETIGMRLPHGYVEEIVSSIQIDHQPYEIAVGPKRIGVTVTWGEIPAKPAQSVFRVAVNETTPSQSDSEAETLADTSVAKR